MKFIFLNRLNQYLLIFTLLMPGFSAAMTIRPLQDRVILEFRTPEGREQTIEVIGFSHEVISPRDAASGLPTGKRQHKPFNVTKGIDNSSSILSGMFIGNETFTDLNIQIIRNTGKGSRVLKTINLKKANVCGVSNMLSSDDEREIELISLCYESISWTWHHKDGDTSTIEDIWGQ